MTKKNSMPHVLIVDDKVANLITLEAVLEDIDCTLVRATSGNEALVATLHHDFACILLDVHMPDMDGFETAQLLRHDKNRQHIPIVFITASEKSLSQILQGYKTGGFDYFIKPFDPDLVRTKVSIYCELYRKRDAIELAKQLKDTNQILRKKTAELEEAYYVAEKEKKEVINELEIVQKKLSLTMGWDVSVSPIQKRNKKREPLQQQDPTVFSVLMVDYEAAFHNYIDASSKHIPSDFQSLSHIANVLGRYNATPKDVIDLHLSVVEELSDKMSPRQVNAYVMEGRIMVLEIMGALAEYYRSRQSLSAQEKLE